MKSQKDPAGKRVWQSEDRKSEEGRNPPVGSQHAEKVTLPNGGDGNGDKSLTLTSQRIPLLIDAIPKT